MSEHYTGRLTIDPDLPWLVMAADRRPHCVVASTCDTFVQELWREEPARIAAQDAHARRLAAAWNCLRGIPTADLEQIAAAPGDAARLAQLATAADEAHQRAREPK